MVNYNLDADYNVLSSHLLPSSVNQWVCSLVLWFPICKIINDGQMLLLEETLFTLKWGISIQYAEKATVTSNRTDNPGKTFFTFSDVSHDFYSSRATPTSWKTRAMSSFPGEFASKLGIPFFNLAKPSSSRIEPLMQFSTLVLSFNHQCWYLEASEPDG